MAAPTFHAPRRFHAGYSWLGRWLRRRTDRLQGEALHVLVLTGMALALLLAHFLSWTLLHERLAASPTATALYWAGQLTLLGAVLGIGVVGFRPALTVTGTRRAVRLTQGPRTLSIPLDAITAVEPISAQRYHRHERRYAATRVFIGVRGDTVLLLRRTDGGPVVIGLPPDAQAALHQWLTAAVAAPAAPAAAA